MADEPEAVLLELQDAIARLNSALARAQEAGIAAEICVSERGIVGSLAPLVAVSGRASRSRVEFVRSL